MVVGVVTAGIVVRQTGGGTGRCRVVAELPCRPCSDRDPTTLAGQARGPAPTPFLYLYSELLPHHSCIDSGRILCYYSKQSASLRGSYAVVLVAHCRPTHDAYTVSIQAPGSAKELPHSPTALPNLLQANMESSSGEY